MKKKIYNFNLVSRLESDIILFLSILSVVLLHFLIPPNKFSLNFGEFIERRRFSFFYILVIYEKVLVLYEKSLSGFSSNLCFKAPPNQKKGFILDNSP